MRRKPKAKKEVTIKIQSHWGRRRLVGWTIRDPWSTSQLGESFKTKEEAIKAYSRILREWKGFYKNTPKIYPTYKYEGAIMNPLAIDWKKGFVPRKKQK